MILFVQASKEGKIIIDKKHVKNKSVLDGLRLDDVKIQATINTKQDVDELIEMLKVTQYTLPPFE